MQFFLWRCFKIFFPILNLTFQPLWLFIIQEAVSAILLWKAVKKLIVNVLIIQWKVRDERWSVAPHVAAAISHFFTSSKKIPPTHGVVWTCQLETENTLRCCRPISSTEDGSENGLFTLRERDIVGIGIMLTRQTFQMLNSKMTFTMTTLMQDHYVSN